MRAGVIRDDGTFVDDEEFSIGEYFTDPGFLVILLGSIELEPALDAAAHAVHSSVICLFQDCGVPVFFERIRTYVELEKVILEYRDVVSHVIILGHGSSHGIHLLDKNEPVSGAEVAKVFRCLEGCPPLQVISFCCHSGTECLAKDLSSEPGISHVIAPSTQFHLQWAVHFINGYLLEFFLEGKDVHTAVSEAISNSNHTPMCVWEDGLCVKQ